MKQAIDKVINNKKRILLRTLCYAFSLFLFDTNKIPIITTKAPNNCNKVKDSFKNIAANIIVEMGPVPATIAKFEELIIFIEADTKKDGITVANMAIRNPRK